MIENAKYATIQLVGNCNDNLFLQTYLGVFKFKDEKPIIVLNGESYPVSYNKDAKSIRCDKWLGNQGLSMSLRDGVWRFVTGTNTGHQSGTSGILQNGGPEIHTLIQQMLEEE